MEYITHETIRRDETISKKHTINMINEKDNKSINKDNKKYKYIEVMKMNSKDTFYSCSPCNYKTKVKCNYMKHLKTTKHKDNNNNKNKIRKIKGQYEHQHEHEHELTPYDENKQHQEEYICHVCHKQYKFRSGLSRHMSVKHISEHEQLQKSNTKSKCKLKLKPKPEIIDTDTEIETDISSNDLKTMFLHLMHENKEIQKKLLDIAKEPQIVQHNHNQKTINIIQFLHEDCKDAMNLSDFLRNLVVTFNDLEQIEEHGYLSGIKQSLIESLNQMDKTKRPIHCTDVKRKQFYVKDDNNWVKESSQDKISNAISVYNTNQLKTLSEWKKQNPEWIDDDKKQNKINKLNRELTSLYSDEEGKRLKNKILNELGNVTLI